MNRLDYMNIQLDYPLEKALKALTEKYQFCYHQLNNLQIDNDDVFIKKAKNCEEIGKMIDMVIRRTNKQ